jgi:hypothetical protein
MTAGAPRRIGLAGGAFTAIHRQVVGPAPDLASLRPEDVPPERLAVARAVWRERAATEFRSIQIMSRFLGDVVAAADPLDVYAGALALVEDEIRHTELCAAVCEALGGAAVLPDPVAPPLPPELLAAPAAERALATAISMLLVNETLSVGFISDLARRCRHPAIRSVLEATIEDEETHQDFGLSYVRASLARFPKSTLPDWRQIVAATLHPHRQHRDTIFARIPPERRTLDAWPEPELVDLGLLSAERQALVLDITIREVLAPRLCELGLDPGADPL